jgi:hypothetical protein
MLHLQPCVKKYYDEDMQMEEVDTLRIGHLKEKKSEDKL